MPLDFMSVLTLRQMTSANSHAPEEINQSGTRSVPCFTHDPLYCTQIQKLIFQTELRFKNSEYNPPPQNKAYIIELIQILCNNLIK